MIDDQMKQPLLIHIAKPCQENWDEMTEDDQGKFCSHCQKTVIDFSQKTDAELIDYFNHHSSFCGRFKNTQINRVIEEPKPVLKRFFDFYSKAAAVFFTLFSFKNFQSFAQTSQPRIENYGQNIDEIHPTKIIFEGTITDDANRLVDSATIFFDNIRVSTSNHAGYYKFEIENVTLRNHVISFSKDHYRWTAFSFHPLMGNTTFNVTMCNYNGKECYSMGMPARPHIYFEKYEFKLANISTKIESSKELKGHVNSLAIIMRNSTTRGGYDPVVMKIYFKNEKDQKLYNQKAQEIIDYLVGKQGIDRDRIKIKTIKNAQKANIIEVIDYTEE